ncbi:hypothetical protein COBT_003483 [Conglomerata obtusa]
MINKNKISEFIQYITTEKDDLFVLSVPMRLTTIYWYTSSMRILGLDIPDREDIINQVLACKGKNGFFGANKNYPPTILSTLNALQIFYALDYSYFDENILQNLNSYFNCDGSVCNDAFGETDTRFSCCAILIIHLLYLNQSYGTCKIMNLSEPLDLLFCEKYKIQIKSVVNYILLCENADGGFGALVGCESHAANTFCCLSALRSLNLLHLVDNDKLTKFLIYRQCKNGGLNGRINKKEDVCYSFWTYSSLLMLNKEHFISKDKLKEFIFSCYDIVGGFSDRKGNEIDLFHTLYSLASLSMLGENGLEKVDPGFGL